MIVDHIGFGVSDYPRAKAFYTEVLKPLGLSLIMEVDPESNEGNKVWACGFGKNGKPEFWIGSDGKTTPPMHIAFVVGTRAEVRAFHAAALKAGARDNGAPGLRPCSVGLSARRPAPDTAARAARAPARAGPAPAARGAPDPPARPRPAPGRCGPG